MNNPVNHPYEIMKFCPACGQNGFHPASEKSLKCEACGFEFFMNAAAAVAGIIHDAEYRVLFTVRARDPYKGTLDLPGGFVDPYESAEEALDREIREELNLRVNSKKYLRSFWNQYTYGGITYSTLDMIFLCEVDNFDSLRLDDEISDYQFYSLDTLDTNKIGIPSIKKAVEAFRLQHK